MRLIQYSLESQSILTVSGGWIALITHMNTQKKSKLIEIFWKFDANFSTVIVLCHQ